MQNFSWKLYRRGMEETKNPRRFQKLISQLEIQGSSSTSQNLQNVAFVSSNSTNSTSSTSEVHNIAYGVSTAHTQGSSSTSQNLQNVAFVSSNSTNSTSSTSEVHNIAYGVSTAHTQEDLEQIDPDDLEEMDLHWEMAMLIIRARRFIKRIGRNLDINGQKIDFDRSKVECFNCHKNRHFARECRAQKNQEIKKREYGRKTVPLENPTENALIAQDGIGGYD
nr:hypothetical protein [Tanacetum cinerariifolium]